LSNQIIQLPGGTQTGAKLDVEELTVTGPNGPNLVERQRYQIAGATEAAIALVFNVPPIGNEYGVGVRQIGSASVNPSAGAEVALSAPPAALTANADTLLTFASAVHHLEVQNKSGVDIYVKTDAPASQGSRKVYANGGSFFSDLPCTTLHIYSTAATALNGTADSNIFVEGRL